MSGIKPTPHSTEDGATLTSTRIKELNRNDVLMGRGAVIDRFEGNVQFRELIKARKVEYSSTCLPDEKNRIAHEIVTTVQQTYSGRFLRRVQDTSLHSEPALTEKDEKTHDISVPSSSTAPLWTLVDHKSAINKVKQALRDCTTGTSNVETTTTATTFNSRPNASPHGGSTMSSTANMINSHVADIKAQSIPVAPTAQMIQPQVYHEPQHTSGCTVDPIIASLLLHPSLHPPSDRYSSELNSSVLPMLNDIIQQRPPQHQEQQSSVPYLPHYSIPHIAPDQTIGLATTMLLNRGDSGQIATLEAQASRRDAAFVSPLSDKNQLSIAPRTPVSESLLQVLQLRRRTCDDLMLSEYNSHPQSSSVLFPESGLGAPEPTLRWNEIPDVYLRLLVPQMQGPSSPMELRVMICKYYCERKRQRKPSVTTSVGVRFD